MAYPATFRDIGEANTTAAQDWTFANAPTRDLTHCYHDYPARMIPQVAGKLLDAYAPGAKSLFDPYCGSGTSLVEGMLRGINVAGTDLNPLARLISKAKTAIPDASKLKRLVAELDKFILSPQHREVPAQISGIGRLDFWFKPQVIEKLGVLKGFIDELPDEATRLFFQVAFSETVREGSNTRNEEFKLYRYEAGRLEHFDPDIYGIINAKLRRNLVGLEQFITRLRRLAQIPRAKLYDFNTAASVPPDQITPASVDIIVTSPPYGDSHTTVAYGQYSRLSAAWLDLPSPAQVDRTLMGGSMLKATPRFASPDLEQAIDAIRLKDEKRSREVAAFYSDLQTSISYVAGLVKPGGHACYVVGNRKVKGVVLPTDVVIRDFFEAQGFSHANTFYRRIPNKRMPLRNSPTNATGKVENTMTTESIVVMHRES
jgi:site-specific DNA-methyltransferase (cytosine-N4-specific)